MALCPRPQTLALGTKRMVRFNPMVKIYCYEKVDENHEFDPNDWHCYTGLLSGGFYDGNNGGGGGGGDGFSDGSFIGNRKQSSACRNRTFSKDSVLTAVSDLIQWREMKEGKKQLIKNSNAHPESNSRESDQYIKRRRSNNANPLLNPVDGLWQWNLLKSVETFVIGAM